MVSCAIYKQAIMANAEDLLTLLSQLSNALSLKDFFGELDGIWAAGGNPLVVQ